MKSIESNNPEQKNGQPIVFSEYGIPVFLPARNTLASLRHFAPDFVHWIEPGKPDSIPEYFPPSGVTIGETPANSGEPDTRIIPGPA